MQFSSLSHRLEQAIVAGHTTISRCISYAALAIGAMLLVLQLLTTPAYATGVYDIPLLPADGSVWVIDDADIISRVNAGQLSRKLSALAQETGTAVRFVTIRRLDYGETIDSFAEQLFDVWFPTAEAQANQVLVVLDSVTNNSAIRTGTAVQAVMSDDIAVSVANETIQVPLRQGDKYNQAFLDAGDRLIAVLSGQPDPGPPTIEAKVNAESTFTSAEDTDQNSATVIVIGFLIAATIIPMVTYYWYVR